MPTISGSNTTTTTGDVLIISFSGAFCDVKTIDSYSDTIVGGTFSKTFSKEFRWSTDSITFSSWSDLVGTGSTSFSGVPTVEGSDTWLEFRYTRGGTGIGDLSVSAIEVVTTQLNAETVAVIPSASACGQPNFCAGVRLKTDSNLQEQLANAVSDMLGHCVKYFKVDPQLRSRDVVLKEFSLYNVNDIKEVKIVVPENEFPDNAISYNALDMDFEDDFEIHITKEAFELAFGQNKRPQERDYLYFPLMDRMYEVNSAYLFKEFMQNGTYYVVGLRKWQDRVNVIRGATAQSIVEDLTIDFEEEFGEEREDEIIQITKPLQYNTLSTGGYDFIRSEIYSDLSIDSQDINNYWTIVAKYHYNLDSVPFGGLAVKYKEPVAIEATDNRAYTSWFNIEKTSYVAGASANTTIIDGLDSGVGLKIDLVHNLSGMTGSTGATGIEVTIGATVYTFDNSFPTLDNSKWYGLVVNLSNTYSEASVYIWEMKYDADAYLTSPQTKQTTDLALVFSESQSVAIGEQKPSGKYYSLLGGELALTNIRVLNETIEEEKQPIILNQYVIKDAHKAIIIDNAIPTLKRPRFSHR